MQVEGGRLPTEVAKVFQDMNNSSHHMNAEFNNVVFSLKIPVFLSSLQPYQVCED